MRGRPWCQAGEAGASSEHALWRRVWEGYSWAPSVEELKGRAWRGKWESGAPWGEWRAEDRLENSLPWDQQTPGALMDRKRRERPVPRPL